MDVYEDKVVIRGIDFNINSSQNGSTDQGYVGDDYVRYLPIAIYELPTGSESEELSETWEIGGFSSSTGENEEVSDGDCLRSSYIPVSNDKSYYLTTVAPIGD